MTMIDDLPGALELFDESERIAIEVGAPNVAVAAMTYRGCALAAA
jgi:hypothetical protein